MLPEIKNEPIPLRSVHSLGLGPAALRSPGEGAPWSVSSPPTWKRPFPYISNYAETALVPAGIR